MSKVKHKVAKSPIHISNRMNQPMFKIFDEFFQKLYGEKDLQEKYNIKPLVYLNENGTVMTTRLDVTEIGLTFIVLEYTIDGEPIKISTIFEVYRENSGKYIFQLTIKSECATIISGEYILEQLNIMVLETSNLKGKMLNMGHNNLDWDIVTPPVRSFDDIFLPNRITNDLRLFRRLYLDQDKLLRYLFVGTPGSGKTESSIVLTNELLSENVTIIKTKIDDYFAEKVELAEILSPSILLLDDVDLSLGSRSTGGFSKHLQMFLDVLDGTQKISNQVGILATTNSLDLLDIAARRAGRFDKTVLFDSITLENIKGIIGKTLKINHNLMETPEVFLDDTIADLFLSNGLTGSHVYNMIDLLYRKLLIEKIPPTVENIIDTLNYDIKTLNLVRDYNTNISDRFDKKSDSVGFNADTPMAANEEELKYVEEPVLDDQVEVRTRRGKTNGRGYR